MIFNMINIEINMESKFVYTYNKNLKRLDHLIISLEHIVKIEFAFTESINVSVNRPLEIKSLRLVTLVDGTTHYISSKVLEEINVLDSEQYLKE